MPGAGRASADRSLWLRSTYSGCPDGQASPDWHASLMRMRCLLVDDNAAFLSSARTLLDRQGVMIVGAASTSAEALRLAAAAAPVSTATPLRATVRSLLDLHRTASSLAAGLVMRRDMVLVI